MGKRIIISVFFVLLFIAGGVFLGEWKKESEMGFVSFKEFEEREFEGNKIVEHKGGLIAGTPAEWQTREGEDGLFLISPDEKCGIEISIRKEKEASIFDIEYSYLLSKIGSSLKPSEQVIEIDGNKAFKRVYSFEDQREYISVKIPRRENVYIFRTYLSSLNKEECAKEFDRFLRTISLL